MYTALPTEHDIHIGMATHGSLCMINQVLFQVEHIKWCVWALFIQNHKCINKQCPVDSKL